MSFLRLVPTGCMSAALTVATASTLRTVMASTTGRIGDEAGRNS